MQTLNLKRLEIWRLRFAAGRSPGGGKVLLVEGFPTAAENQFDAAVENSHNLSNLNTDYTLHLKVVYFIIHNNPCAVGVPFLHETTYNQNSPMQVFSPASQRL